MIWKGVMTADVNYACVPIPMCFSFFFCSYLTMYVCLFSICQSVSVGR